MKASKYVKLMEFVAEKCDQPFEFARLATLALKNKNESKNETNAYKTPLCLQYTTNGVIPHITWELSAFISDENAPLLVPLPSVIAMKDSIKKFGRSFSEFANFRNNRPFVLTISDPLSGITTGYNDRQGISVWTPSGRCQINSENYSDIVSSFRPNICQSLCDGDTPINASKKRLSHSVNRTLSYLDECVTFADTIVLGSIEGGFNMDSRLYSAKETAQRAVHGFIVDGFHTNGKETETDFEVETVKPFLKEIKKILPENKPLAMFGAFNPQTTLELIKCGIDLFDSSYATCLTEKGFALTFTEFNIVELKYETLDLNNVEYKEDFRVLSSTCQCYACKNNFTRAYINHLLNASEMLATVLLMLHNLENYYEFFRQIRYQLTTVN